jgi:uncharacterized protein involved in exopolysaccharide biosynthesis
MQNSPPNNPPYSVPEDEIDLAEYARVIWRWRLVIAGLIIAALFLSGLASFYFHQKPKYKAEVTLLLTSERQSAGPNLGSLSGLAANFGFSGITGGDPSEIYEDILNSRNFLKNYAYETLPTLKNPQGIQVSNFFNVVSEKSDSNEVGISVAGALNGTIEFKKEKNIYILAVTSKDPVFSTALANDLIKKLEKYNREQRTSKLQKNRIFIEERIKEIERELRDSRERLTSFRKKNMRLDVARAPELLDQQEWLTEDVKLKQEVYLVLKKEHEMAKIEEEKDKPYIQVLDEAIKPGPSYKVSTKIIFMAFTAFSVFAGLFLTFIFEFVYNRHFLPDRYQLLLDKIRK